MRTPKELRELDRLVGRVQGLDGTKPDAIITRLWPSKIPGSLRAKCSVCARHVSLGPQSGQLAVAKWPDVPILCPFCALARANAEAATVV